VVHLAEPTPLHTVSNQIYNQNNQLIMTMAKKINPNQITLPVFLCTVIMMMGTLTVQASEVTGTLSSDGSSDNNGTTTEDISGTVLSDDESNNTSGTRRNNDSDSNDAPSGSVFGASTDNTNATATPGFPNAGYAPEKESPLSLNSIWSSMVTLFKKIVSF
jgi:hypothetical protein